MSNCTVEQARSNLQRANETRCAMSEVRMELAAGIIAFAEAIEDPRSGALRVFDLLRSIRQVGPHKARRVMFRAGVGELKRIRDLTDRQRQALVLELAGRGQR